MNITKKVAEKISSAGNTIAETVIETLANIEIERRVKIITQGVNRLENLEKEFKKIDGKFDSVSYDKDGNKIETMSQKRFDEIKKAKEGLETFTKLFNKCLEENKQEDYDKLNGMVSIKQPGSGENKSEA